MFVACNGFTSNQTQLTTFSTPIPPTLAINSTQNYTLRGLEPFTEYLVTLRVFNPKGDGPSVAIAATTDEGGK